MKIALITTTVNVPTVLSLYRKLDPDVRFFVAMDRKTPAEAFDFCNQLDNCHVCEHDHEYACADLTGWNTIARRNIALLEALKWGADAIVTIDDDNIPVDPFYFESVRRAIECPFNGITSANDWFDVGQLLDPVAPHRGFPHDRSFDPFDPFDKCSGRSGRSGQIPSFSFVIGARVGVAAGACLGDPDISAATRMVSGPISHRVSELLRSGIVVDPRRTKTVFNSQNTAFIRELAPCFLMVPSYGRYDDIFASLVAQRVMRERGYYTHFGCPMVWQQRNPHNLLADLRNEQWGAEHILEFSAWLDGFCGVHDVIGFLRVMATNLPKFILSADRRAQELWLAWLSDCERVMK